MAESIAAFVRNAKRNENSDMSRAIEHWEKDLSWLKSEYYDGLFDGSFPWPTTD